MTANATFFGARRRIAPPRHPSKMRTALQACQICQPVAVWAGIVGYLANAGYIDLSEKLGEKVNRFLVLLIHSAQRQGTWLITCESVASRSAHSGLHLPVRPRKGTLSCVLAFYLPAPFSALFSPLRKPKRRSASILISPHRPCTSTGMVAATAGRFLPLVLATGHRRAFSMPRRCSACIIRPNITCRPCRIRSSSRAAMQFTGLTKQGRSAALPRMAAYVSPLPTRPCFTKWCKRKAHGLASQARRCWGLIRPVSTTKSMPTKSSLNGNSAKKYPQTDPARLPLSRSQPTSCSIPF